VTVPTAPPDVASTAHACRDWTELAAAAAGCRVCPELVAGRTQVVVGEAPPGSRLVLVGEAPGAAEDESGHPFVGRSGQLLDRILGEVGLVRAEIAVLNVVKCRPPGNRTPRSAEVAACSGWLYRQLELIAPELICTLGLSAAQRFLGRRAVLAAARGRVHLVEGRRLLATYHPSAALRFGPRGEPLAALRADLALVADLLRSDPER